LLTDRWLVTTTAECSASNTTADAAGSLANGNPGFGLMLRCSSSPGVLVFSTIRTIDTFVLSSPHTFALDARVDSIATFDIGAWQAGMQFTIEALNTGAVRSLLSVRGNVVTYHMLSGASGVQVVQTYPVDALFHHYEFIVNGHSAEWRRDGVLQANTTTFPTNNGSLYIRLRSASSATGETSRGHVDNVSVVRP